MELMKTNNSQWKALRMVYAAGWCGLLTDREGNPAGEERGRKFTHKLAVGEDAHAIACKLTKELRLALRGNSAPVAGFEGPINYPKLKY
jgi:hypothetical protein